MSMPTPTTPIRHSTGKIIGLALAAGITAILALGAFAAGGGLLWADGERDADGFVNTDTESIQTSGRAVTTGHMDLQLDGAGDFLEAIGSGDLKVTADAGDGGTFIGIARTADVDRYLAGVERAVVTDYSDWFDPDYHQVPGERTPADPGSRSFWVAQAAGDGKQSLTWDVQDGDWTAVVMHPDASRQVAADVSGGVSAPSFLPYAIVSLAFGAIFAAGAAAFLWLLFRGPRDGARPEEQPTVVLPGEPSPGV
jgi:hypothetical protein